MSSLCVFFCGTFFFNVKLYKEDLNVVIKNSRELKKPVSWWILFPVLDSLTDNELGAINRHMNSVSFQEIGYLVIT